MPKSKTTAVPDPPAADGLSLGLPVDLVSSGALTDDFVAPPVSLLDTRQDYWRKRKRQWLALGFDGALGREDQGTGQVYASYTIVGQQKYGKGWAKQGANSVANTTSVFDPVLCEVVYRWWCPPAGRVLDPFAGEVVKGVVAGCLGLEYDGVELRSVQVEANRKQFDAMKAPVQCVPLWHCGDSAKLSAARGLRGDYDLVFTSPPYFDLEVYEGGSKDASTWRDYDQFMDFMYDVYQQCIARLKPNRFLVVKVGEVRSKDTGMMRGFVPDTVDLLQQLGLYLYNDAVLVTPFGTAPIRARRSFPSMRKLLPVHQRVLVFYNGDDQRDIKELFGDKC